MAEVYSQCGEPNYSTAKETNTSGSVQTKSRSRNSLSSTFNETTQVTEEWFYNCGDGRFNIHLIFKGGTLKKIISGERGSGTSYCEGIENNPNNVRDDASNEETKLNNAAKRDFIKAETERIEEETYQERMRSYDEKIKALEEEAEKYKRRHEEKTNKYQDDSDNDFDPLGIYSQE